MDLANILIVEDEQVFANLVQFQLNTLGFTLENIICVASINEAVEVKVVVLVFLVEVRAHLQQRTLLLPKT